MSIDGNVVVADLGTVAGLLGLQLIGPGRIDLADRIPASWEWWRRR